MLQDIKSHLGTSMHSVRRFLERPITVTEGNLTLGSSPRALRAQARQERRERVKRMQRDLFTMMQQHPGSRHLMRHLDLCERSLRSGGLEALDKLPIRIVAKGLNQMESLVWDWSPAGLAELRSRMAVMVKNRAHEVRREAAAFPASLPRELAHEDDSQVSEADVSEVDHSEFEEMERSWAGCLPEAVASAQAAEATA